MINIYGFIFLLSIIVAAISQIILKISAKSSHKNLLKEYLNRYVIIGYILMVISSVLTTIAYKGIPLSYGPIFNSLGYLVVGTLGWLILKEKMTKRKIFGYCLIIIGVFITSI